MKRLTRQLLFWTPRVLTMLYAAFISLFALDVFGEGYGLWGTIVALTMHLIPTGLILIALVIAWRWEWVGALLFISLASGYTFWALSHPSWILGISGPMFLVGVLFFINWLYRHELCAGGSIERNAS